VGDLDRREWTRVYASLAFLFPLSGIPDYKHAAMQRTSLFLASALRASENSAVRSARVPVLAQRRFMSELVQPAAGAWDLQPLHPERRVLTRQTDSLRIRLTGELKNAMKVCLVSSGCDTS
jgi:hypothetical protein